MSTSDQTRRAVDSYRNDARFRAVAQSVVAEVLTEHGDVDPELANREAHDIALAVAVRLLQRVFEEDAELAAARLERDHFKALAEKTLSLRPTVVPLSTGTVDPAKRPR